MSEEPGSSRRDFFGRAWRDALAAAPKVAPKPFAVASALSAEKQRVTEAAGLPRFVPPSAATAAAVSGTVTLDELLARAAVAGLEGRAEAVRALARRSIRLTPDTAGRSSVGGERCLAQIDLASIAALGATPELPAEGALVFGDDRVVLVSAPGPVSGAEPVQPSVELSLPRVWSAPVEALGLGTDERTAWIALRVWLAERQGVELHDSTPGFLALHRLLGYPDETGGDMPLRCELLDAGVAHDDEPYPRMHPRARELEPRSARWRLLLQLSVGDAERVYFWITAEDLEAGDFNRVRVMR